MIFVDTGAWFAVAVRNDPDHEAAIRWLERNREPLITTDHVLAETATLIRMRDKTARGHRLVERLGIIHAFAFDSHFNEYPGILRLPR